MDNKIKFEVCVDSLESCIEAIKGGANRLELCGGSSLFQGGLTPTYGMMVIIKEQLEQFELQQHRGVEIFVMIRPRSGDFLYSKGEISIMKHDIKIVKEIGGCFKGIVIGLLNENGTIDKEKTEELVELAYPLSVTFHRAFDMSRNLKESFNTICSIKSNPSGGIINRILTSGMESSVIEGIDNIKELIKLSQGTHITILPGGGITTRNINKIVKKCSPLTEFHISGRVVIDSPMKYRNSTGVFMGGSLRESEYQLAIVDNNKIKDFINKSK